MLSPPTPRILLRGRCNTIQLFHLRFSVVGLQRDRLRMIRQIYLNDVWNEERLRHEITYQVGREGLNKGVFQELFLGLR